MSEPYENTLSIDELRKEVRHCWNMQRAFTEALAELPDVPDHLALRLLVDVRGGFPEMWEIGKNEQRKHPWGTVPSKTEYEIAQGFWSIIRDAFRARAHPAPSQSMDAVREALEPFAKCADYIDADDRARSEIEDGTYATPDDEWAKFRLLVSDYRRARSVLAALQAAGEGE